MKKLFALLVALMMMLSLLPASAEGVMFVRAGGSFGMALDANGVIWGWGDNGSGQLGNGNNKRAYFPIPCATGIDGTQVKDIQCGNLNTLFLMQDGTVWTCGRNNYGQQGQKTKKEYVFTPIQIPGLENIEKIACGFGQCLALDADGRVWSWGRNSNGQVGDGTKKGVKEPIMLDMENIVDISCGGKFNMAMAADGTVWGWGDNEYGQLGDGLKLKDVVKPTKLAVSGMYTKVVCGGDVGFGIDENGKLWAWGRNDYWQLGTKAVGKYTKTPVEVSLPEGTVVTEIYAYNSHTAAITNEGALWQWGGVFHGQVGNGERPWRDVPQEACPASGVVGTAVGSLQSYLLAEDGTLYGCGCNEYGQTGAYRRMRYYVDRWMNTGLNLVSGQWADPGND